jgi:hypothetical protein
MTHHLVTRHLPPPGAIVGTERLDAIKDLLTVLGIGECLHEVFPRIGLSDRVTYEQ